ncbi:uncharacterized protein LOC107365464 isoform X2 [Tetranychus urticae]|uniref:Uncharacterized protein n=1 Tax=Tetranychus urticae TaxID=32264 RepID=T1KMR3_TETUR|nr:uncharacterized protein LOC107365464 isoform X2 [Tetranychus urticae]XP_025017262.1 uncharacterized protein LOC107365464 isoform X2 [Tetranychus urticae]XP_025017263.1 uncharacterized protein LOC107365464 isoform X2 [Tetranychus urticae]XP_025017264.1 uncharacterized protein LOC107365464 isoform X2 [Tetranychus urticae]
MERNNNSDKTTFKVKFLGEYHDMVIDWNDDKYEYKQQQVFEQLESLTGIPIKYKTLFRLLEARPNLRGDYPNDEIWFRIDGEVTKRYLYFHNNREPVNYDIRYDCDFVKDNIHDVCIMDGERFQLGFFVRYDSMSLKRIGIGYYLVPEIWVEEGVCTYCFCQHSHTKSYFKRIKDLVTNEELNSQISHRVQPLEENMRYNDDSEDELNKVYEEYNVRQLLGNNCHLYQWRWENEEEGVDIIINLEQYQRMRG